MLHTTPVRRQHSTEEGYLLVWVVFLLFVFTLWLSLAAPRAAKEIQRDRELETMHRGKQYIRAVQLYYRKFHAYPPNPNALINTNEIRFLRKKYIDPTTGKDDWRPIRFGQAKTQSLGFFGKPIAGAGSAGGSVLAGVGPSGGIGLGGSLGGALGGSSIGSGIGGSTFGGTSLFGSGNSTSPGSSTATGAGSTTGTSGTSGNSTGTSTSSSGSSDSSSAFGSSNQTFGGAGIIGFSPASTKASISIYKKKQHYNEWEFVYDPLTDISTQSGNTGMVGQPASSTSTPVGSSSFGSSFGTGSGFGSGSGFGTTPSPTPSPGSGTTPTTPQR